MPKFYDASSLGTPTNYINFNDFKGSPLFRIESWFASRRELREMDIPLPQSSGVDDFDAFIGKEYLVIRGRMFPGNDSEYNSGREHLRKVASLGVSQNDTNSDRGYVPYKWAENVLKQVFVKVLYVDLPETAQMGQIQPFSMVCKIKYPVAYAQQAQFGTLAMSATGTGLGGALLPDIIPLLIGGSVGSGSSLPLILPAVLGGVGASSGSITLNNIGDYETFPSIVITGPISKPKIVNMTSGQFMEFDLNLTSTSDNIVIVYDQKSLSMTSNGVNVYGKLTQGSTPFKIMPGPVVFAMSGQSVGAGAQATISFLPAWPLS